MSQFKILIVDSYEEVSKEAFKIFKKAFDRGAKNIGLATGSTPIRLYELFIEDYKKNKIYEQLNYFNLDEYHGLVKEHPQSYYSFMQEKLFKHINARHTYIPDGNKSIEESITEYQKILDENPIDIQLLGIGNNGHIGFNEPGTPFDIKTNFVKLKNMTRQANKRFFDNDITQVPEYAITMGIADIMAAKKIVVLASGEAKAEAVQKMIQGVGTVDMPASALQKHPDVTVIVDYKAAKKLNLPYLCVDVSSTRIKIAKFNNNYMFENLVIEDIDNRDIVEIVENLIDKYLTDEMYKIGVSISGHVLNGVVNSPKLGFDNFNLERHLRKRFSKLVKVVNRANVSAYGEYKTNFSTYDSLYYMSLGTGIGGGYIANQKIVSGAHGLAGELGQIVDRASELTLEEYYHNFLKSDSNQFINGLAAAIQNIIHIVEPEVIMIDLKNPKVQPEIIEEVENKVKKFLFSWTDEIRCKIYLSKLEHESLIGMGYYMRDC